MLKPPTMEDVAREAGVSRALVSLVMRDIPQVSEKRRAAVLEAAGKLGYRPNVLARNLASHRTGTLGVLVNDLHNPFFSEVIDGIEEEAESHGLQVLILNGGRSLDREERAIETFLQFRVEGLVLVGTRLDNDSLASANAQVPVAVVASGWDHGPVDTITTDDAIGAGLAVEHLVSLGHRSIVHLDGAQNISALPRRNGYVAAMRKHGLEPRVALAGDSDGDAHAAIDVVLDSGEPPSAIFAFNDLAAAGALDRLDDLSTRVPEEISLVGYDNTFIAGLHHLSLTTINQPRAMFGSLPTSTLTELLDAGRDPTVQLRLDPELVVRGSTGPVPPSHISTLEESP